MSIAKKSYGTPLLHTGMIQQNVLTSVKGAPPPTRAASAGPEDHNSEVKLYDNRDKINVGARDGTFFRIQSA